MAKVPNGVETLSKIYIAWVGRTNVTETDDRRADDIYWTWTQPLANQVNQINGHLNIYVFAKWQHSDCYLCKGDGEHSVWHDDAVTVTCVKVMVNIVYDMSMQWLLPV